MLCLCVFEISFIQENFQGSFPPERSEPCVQQEGKLSFKFSCRFPRSNLFSSPVSLPRYHRSYLVFQTIPPLVKSSSLEFELPPYSFSHSGPGSSPFVNHCTGYWRLIRASHWTNGGAIPLSWVVQSLNGYLSYDRSLFWHSLQEIEKMKILVEIVL